MSSFDDMDFPFDANASGEFFDGLATVDESEPQFGEPRFSAAVPPHIAPETIAHWDTDELW